MPKPTFFNLPAEKRQTLIQAVKEEFSRTSLAEACISNIVERANIPRGSFYQYFEDKEDAYFYILSEFTEQLKGTFSQFLHARQGELFLTMVDFFRYVITEEENVDLLEQAFLNLNYKIESAFMKTFIDLPNHSHDVNILQHINRDRLNFTSEKEFTHLMNIIIAVTFRNFIEKYAHNLTNEEALNNYTIELKLLQNGLVNNT